MPGTLTAIMGASGAGKTTLLNIINFRNRGNLKISGDVKINGESVKTTAAISSISGYVQQEDMFIGYLKVKEQLKFQVNIFNFHLFFISFKNILYLIGNDENRKSTNK